MNVLVVDDHPDGAKMIAMLLGIYGHECRTALTGTEALAIAEDFVPELAIVDIGLPDISGYEVARALRGKLGATVYLAAITGWGQAEDRAKAFAAGFDQHVVKPVDGKILSQVVTDAVARLTPA